MKLFETILSIIFPEHCLGCGKKDMVLCNKCAFKLPRGFSPEKGVLVALDYGDKRVKKAVWLLKYRNKRSLAKVFAERVFDQLSEELAEWRLTENFTEPLLIPIPISAKRFRERGYNQAELVARELEKLFGGSLPLTACILDKSRHTESQVTTRDRKERLKNLRDSFSIKDAETVRGRNIVLLDDVMTTGATLHEARSTLKKAGARRIMCVAVAH